VHPVSLRSQIRVGLPRSPDDRDLAQRWRKRCGVESDEVTGGDGGDDDDVLLFRCSVDRTCTVG
jgi:hypothetical protein